MVGVKMKSLNDLQIRNTRGKRYKLHDDRTGNVREEVRKNILKVQKKIVQNLRRREFGATDINENISSQSSVRHKSEIKLKIRWTV